MTMTYEIRDTNGAESESIIQLCDGPEMLAAVVEWATDWTVRTVEVGS